MVQHIGNGLENENQSDCFPTFHQPAVDCGWFLLQKTVKNHLQNAVLQVKICTENEIQSISTSKTLKKQPQNAVLQVENGLENQIQFCSHFVEIGKDNQNRILPLFPDFYSIYC